MTVGTSFRPARADEADAVLALIGADPISRARVAGPWPSDAQRRGFARVLSHPDHLLLVGERDDRIVATLTLSFLPELARDGERAQLESVHVAADQRGRGTGRALVEHAIERARQRGCALIQLTTDKRRTDAHRFYAALGFVASHEGLKRAL